MTLVGLPWTAWLLLFASVGLGLAIVVLFYRSQRRRPGSHQND